MRVWRVLWLSVVYGIATRAQRWFVAELQFTIDNIEHKNTLGTLLDHGLSLSLTRTSTIPLKKYGTRGYKTLLPMW